MIFGKYDIVIFREGKSGSNNLRLRGWIIILFCICVLSVCAINFWLWQQWLNARHLKTELGQAEKIIAEQKSQTVRLAEKITGLGNDLERMQKFDARLRLMMNMEKDISEAGETPGDFSSTYLPLHRQELAVRKMQEFLDRLSESGRLEEVRQQDLLRLLRENRSKLAAMPSIWPVSGFISSSFGVRNSPFGKSGQFHKGLDITNRAGTPVIAPAEGTVSMAGSDGAYGISVEIDHGAGIVTKYAHLQRAQVKQGQWIKRGETLGYVGMTGRTTGPHLHYEVYLNGAPVNPMRYILE